MRTMLVLIVIFSNVFVSINASYFVEKTYYLDSIEESLDFSKSNPKFNSLYVSFNGDTPIDYYLDAKDDLGLSQNKNLKEIYAYESTWLKFFEKCYLPQVKEVFFWVGVEDWKYLLAFPNLKTYRSWTRPSFEGFVDYSPKLEVIHFFESTFEDFSEEELIAIGQLHSLRKIRYSFNAFYSEQKLEIIQEEMQSMFPHIKIELYLNPPRTDRD